MSSIYWVNIWNNFIIQNLLLFAYRKKRLKHWFVSNWTQIFRFTAKNEKHISRIKQIWLKLATRHECETDAYNSYKQRNTDNVPSMKRIEKEDRQTTHKWVNNSQKSTHLKRNKQLVEIQTWPFITYLTYETLKTVCSLFFFYRSRWAFFRCVSAPGILWEMKDRE